jgi:hypothetical protein
MYAFLNIFFFAFHSVLIGFILVGWVWRKTRMAHLILATLTALSWFGLGIWFGFGYCPCTDWHWRVRMQLGFYDMPTSYIKFLIDRPTGWDVSPRFVDASTLVLFLAVVAASVWLNLADWRRKSLPR